MVTKEMVLSHPSITLDVYHHFFMNLIKRQNKNIKKMTIFGEEVISALAGFYANRLSRLNSSSLWKA